MATKNEPEWTHADHYQSHADWLSTLQAAPPLNSIKIPQCRFFHSSCFSLIEFPQILLILQQQVISNERVVTGAYNCPPCIKFLPSPIDTTPVI